MIDHSFLSPFPGHTGESSSFGVRLNKEGCMEIEAMLPIEGVDQGMRKDLKILPLSFLIDIIYKSPSHMRYNEGEWKELI